MPNIVKTFAAPKIAFVIAMLFLVACVSTQNKRDEAQLHLQIGSGYLVAGNYPEAMREMLVAEELDPDNEVIQNNLGLAYFVREKNELAEKHLKTALKIKPKYSEARNNLARVEIELGKTDEAITELETVLADLTYTAADKAWVNLGLAYFRKGQFQQAKQKFTEALKLNRQHCLARTLYGRSLLELNEIKSAAETLDEAVQVCKASGYDEPHYFSGLAYMRMGNSDKAIARMEEVVRLYPTGKYTAKAKNMLVTLRQREGQ